MSDNKVTIAREILSEAFEHDEIQIEHARRVAGKIYGETPRDSEAIAVALLHDVIEDAGAQYASEIEARLGGRILEACEALTRRAGDNYLYHYITLQVSADPIARRVKLADIEHNMDLTRLQKIGPKDLERIEKYHEARAILLGGVD